jgi:hypothetical protein
MIKVTITQDGERLDAIEFDANNVIASAGGLRVVFRDAMQECSANGLWHQVTHAAGTVAGRSYLRGADEPPEAVIDAPLSIGEASDLRPDPRDDIEQDPGDRADTNLYHLDRDPDETDEEYRERCTMLGCDESGHIRLPRRRPAACLIPCIICGRPLEDDSAGNNQPVRGLAFQCGGHWPSAVCDAAPGWLEVNICEPCLQRAAGRRLVLHGDRASRSLPAIYKLWQWPRRSKDQDLP